MAKVLVTCTKCGTKHEKADTDKDRGRIEIRVTPELLERADALIDHLSRMRGMACTRSDVVRESLAIGIRMLEQEKADARGAKKKPSRLKKKVRA